MDYVPYHRAWKLHNDEGKLVASHLQNDTVMLNSLLCVIAYRPHIVDKSELAEILPSLDDWRLQDRIFEIWYCAFTIRLLVSGDVP